MLACFSSKKGQITLFTILIFQVVFVFFGMVINVGMLVHDKINLQNSLDLAAFYGAQKQAEVLNVMAHINYQMRQNYKLLAWRYRVLGTVSRQFEDGDRYGDNIWCPKNATSSPAPQRCELDSQYLDAQYFICMNSLWEEGDRDNYCDKKDASIRLPDINDGNSLIGNLIVAPIGLFSLVNANTVKGLQTQALQNLKGDEYKNWLLTQAILTQFRLDQKDRRAMLIELYSKTLMQDRDLNGQNIAEGVFYTFKHNLSYTNYKNFIGDGDSPPDQIISEINNPDSCKLCSYNSFKDMPFNLVFKTQFIAPFLNYLLSNGNGGSRRATFTLQAHTQTPSTIPQNPYASLFQFNEEEKYLRIDGGNGTITPLTLGINKKPELTAYYGLAIELGYDSVINLFSPGRVDGLKLRASSFAKPFGSTIGPSSEEQDPLLRKHLRDKLINANPARIKDLLTDGLQPNHSTTPGDKFGLLDYNLQRQNYLRKYRNVTPPSSNPKPYSVKYFTYFNRSDPLAYSTDDRGNQEDKYLFLKRAELLAISPDKYDVMNYTFFNNYMQFYFPKLCKLLSEKPNETCQDPNNPIEIQQDSSFDYAGIDIFVRADLGFPYESNSELLNRDIFQEPEGDHSDLLHESPPKNTVGNLASFLTSFVPTTDRNRYDNYSFPGEAFMECFRSGDSSKEGSPSSCGVGGRAGYSVKLISCSRVNLLDPKPPNLEKFCN